MHAGGVERGLAIGGRPPFNFSPGIGYDTNILYEFAPDMLRITTAPGVELRARVADSRFDGDHLVRTWSIDGRSEALRALLADPRVQDPEPRSDGAAQAATPGATEVMKASPNFPLALAWAAWKALHSASTPAPSP